MTLAEAIELRDAYKAALLAIAGGQEYTIAGRTLRRADAAFVETTFHKYDSLATSLAAGRSGGPRVYRVVPRDL